jgi:hypothetical protein
MDWQIITTAPFDRDLEIAVLDDDGAHALVFQWRRAYGGSVTSATNKPVDVRPTHWRE